MNYTYKTFIPVHYYDFYACNLWSINQIYNFASRGHFSVKLNINRLGCEDINLKYTYLNLFINKLLWIHMIILTLAIFSLLNTWSIINKAFENYLRNKKKFEEESFDKVSLYLFYIKYIN